VVRVHSSLTWVIRAPGFTLGFLAGSVLFIFKFFVLCFSLSTLCLAYPMLSVSLDCPFTIGYSVFSIVNLHALVMKEMKQKY
jgi:hypothetical protein